MLKNFSREWLKGLLLTLIVSGFCLSTSMSYAYLADIKIYEKKDITKLSDDVVSSAYLDVIVEIEAIYLYHRTTGFTPREYQQYKDLLRYRYLLKSELQRRQLDIPVVDHDNTP